MPPVINPNPYLTSNWPERSKVTVTFSYNEPGVRGARGASGGSLRISMITTRETDLTPYSTYDLTYTTETYTSFGLGDASYSIKELVFSGRYGLIPVGVGTNEYVIKRLWSPVLYNQTTPSTTLPKIFYCTSDINASLGTGWKWYLQSRSIYSAISQSTAYAWYDSNTGAETPGRLNPYGGGDGATEELSSNPNQQPFIEVPGVGTVYVGVLSTSDPFALSASIRGGITNHLLFKGYTQAQVDEYFKTGKTPTLPGNNSITGPGKSVPTPPLKFVDYGEATVSVKTSNGYNHIPQRTLEDRPYIFQRYTDGKSNLYERKFVFTHIPQTISYTPGGTEWNEVPRSTDSPLVEWDSWTLTKVQMSFIVAGVRNESGVIVPDGIDVDVEDELQMLRAMATLPFPVTIFGLDDIFDLQLRQASITGVPSEWAITDLSITSKRRTTFTPSLISVAQINLSLTEYPIEKQNIYRLPKLQIPNTPPPPPNPGGGNPSGPDLWTPILQPSVRDGMVLPTAIG